MLRRKTGKMPVFSLTLLLLFLLLLATGCGPGSSSQTPTQPPPPQEVKTPEPEPKPVLHYVTRDINPGDFLMVYLNNLQEGQDIQISSPLLGSTSPPFRAYESGKIAWAGVSYRTKPGVYPLTVKVLQAGSMVDEFQESINVKPKDFATQYLQVTKEVLAKRDSDLLEKDMVHVNKAKSSSHPEPLWEQTFIMPVEGRISTEFGFIRYINKVESGRHSGLDIAASKGTPVKAANSGVVVLSRNLYVTGNTIIIDHGFNLFSAYSHMDSRIAQAGDKVKKGDIIGKVGSTGFSTGPHLHWTLSIGSTFVNPWLFQELDPLNLLKNNP